MRERLTVSFVLLSLVLVTGALLIRSYTLETNLRQHESDALRRDALSTRVLIEERLELDQEVDQSFLATVVGRDRSIEFVRDDRPTVTAEGAGYALESSRQDDLDTSLAGGGGTITLSESGQVVADLVNEDRRSILLVLALIVLLAGGAGYVVSRLLSAPFRALAGAAEALGRGRFDLELPRTRIPEARAIGQALHGSAGRLQERLTREQEFAEHASHVLRTPLTGLRLELEELSLRSDLPEDARAAAARSLARIDGMDVVAGELVQISRRGSLVAGAEIPLRDLATQCAQTWADALADLDRPLTAAVEGNLEMTYTPGPVEHILDLLLVDVLRRGQGAVRMVFDANVDGNLRIRVVCAGDLKPGRGQGVEVPVAQARAVISALGGRLEGDNPMTGLEVLLPRR